MPQTSKEIADSFIIFINKGMNLFNRATVNKFYKEETKVNL